MSWCVCLYLFAVKLILPGGNSASQQQQNLTTVSIKYILESVFCGLNMKLLHSGLIADSVDVCSLWTMQLVDADRTRGLQTRR